MKNMFIVAAQNDNDYLNEKKNKTKLWNVEYGNYCTCRFCVGHYVLYFIYTVGEREGREL